MQTNNHIKLIWPIIKNMISPDQTPYVCTYSATWRCNAMCRCCHIPQKPNTYEMSLDEVEKAFGQLPRITSIRITGGEPFIREDLSRIVNIIKGKTDVQTILITTNGIFTERIVDLIKETGGKNIRLKLSLLGYENSHDERTGINGAYFLVSLSR